jgi:hypothetical protein
MDNEDFDPGFEIGPFAQAVQLSYNYPVNTIIRSPTPSKFTVGDTVKLKTGDAPQRVLEIRWCKVTRNYTVRCEYLKSRKQLSFRSASDYELYKPENKTEVTKEDTMKGKLFQTLDGSVYGEGLVIDGDGKYVLKLNNGEYKAYASTELKRVMPFTFDVIFSGMNSKRYSYLGRVGSVEVGDVLMDSKDFTIARVVAVGTESDSATKAFEGVKLVTAPLA